MRFFIPRSFFERDSPFRPVAFFACWIFVALTALCSHAQNAAISTPHSLDSDISIPKAVGTLGRHDENALLEIQQHIATVGSEAWTGMQATGQIVFGPKDSTGYAATLSMEGRDQFRLDTQTANGPMSLRIHGPIGKIREQGEPDEIIPPETAREGIFPFAIVRTAHFPGKRVSILDGGFVTEDGVRYHRITIEFPKIGGTSFSSASQMAPMDLYFDASTHLLSKSVTYSPISNTRQVRFKRVVTYSDYRRVGSVMVPFHFVESMDGEQYWTLQLTDVQLNPGLDPTYFQF